MLVHHNKTVWSEINQAITALGGKYVGGMGKDSHWEIPYQITVKNDKTHARVQKALELINEVGRLLTEELK